MHSMLLNVINAIVPIEPSEQELITSCFKSFRLQKGQFFLESGKVDQYIGFINKGLVRYFVYKNDEEATFEFTKEGEFIADYQSFTNKVPSVQNIQAIEDCELLIINNNDLQRIFNTAKHGNLLGRIIIEHRFDVMVTQLLSIYMHSHEERYKKFIESYSELSQRIPQYLIASYVGVKPQSLSRMRSRFSKNIN
ncbi:MAG: Crp/Fnr family transcriptional regulator [Bacteroidetes bacterium]|nr:Crp/Fnr family transcriptional regulator [Bacteroidota bacterium]